MKKKKWQAIFLIFTCTLLPVANDSCMLSFTKSTKSAKEEKLVVKIYTSSADLERDLAGLDVDVTCNGKKNYTICLINIPTLKNAECELLLQSTPPHEIVIPNGKKYIPCDVYVTLEQSPHCFEVQNSKITRKAEEEGQIPDDPSISSKKPPAINIPTSTTSTQGQITMEPSLSSKELVSSTKTEQTLSTSSKAYSTTTATSKRPQQTTAHGQGNKQSPKPTTSSIGKNTQTSTKGNTENSAENSCECYLFKGLTIFLSILCCLLTVGLIFFSYKWYSTCKNQCRCKLDEIRALNDLNFYNHEQNE